MKKPLTLCIAIILISINAWSQKDKPTVYTNISQIPSYLKMTKSFAKVSNTVVNKQVSPQNNNLKGKITTDAASPFAPGMIKENIINANGFSNGTNGRIALLISTTPSYQANDIHNVNVAVIPLRKPNGDYVFSTSVPVKYNELSAAILNSSWKITRVDDGSFYIVSAATGDRLGINAASTGAAPEVKMMPGSEAFKTKLYVYQQGPCNSSPLALYCPYYRTFIGRKMINARTVSFVAIKAADFLAGRIPSGVSIGWDFKTDQFYPPPGPAHILVSYFAFLSAKPTDKDGDGAVAATCGGTDCDDNDPGRHPGRIEVCDPNHIDEDCDPSTCGARDVDGDGHIDINCYNIDPRTGVITSQGDDCNDSNPAIYPGVMYYISDTMIGVCGMGEFAVQAGYRAVYQPNGTAIVIPK